MRLYLNYTFLIGEYMLYSILITSYESGGKGADFLRENLMSILQQTYRPIQVVVSDHSRDDAIQTMIETLDLSSIEFVYDRYTKHYGNPCHNWNNALKFAKGDLLHYLALDDALASPDAVAKVVNFMTENPTVQWAATAHRINPSGKVFIPRWNPHILTGNTLSGPSAIVLRSTLKHVCLDPHFIWFLDTDWYYRLYKEAGKPGIFSTVIWVNRHHAGQLSHTVCTSARQRTELLLLHTKYGSPLPAAT